MTAPKVEEIRARRVAGTRIRLVDLDYLLTKLDEAEKANPPVQVGSPDGSQVYEIPLTEYLEQMNANQIFRATQAESKLAAAEERERALIAGVKEAQQYIEARMHPDDWGVPCVYVEELIPILSRLLPSTPTEEGNSHE